MILFNYKLLYTFFAKSLNLPFQYRWLNLNLGSSYSKSFKSSLRLNREFILLLIDKNGWFVEFLIWRIIWTLYPSFLSSILYFTLEKIMFKKPVKQWASIKPNTITSSSFLLIRNTSKLHYVTLQERYINCWPYAHGNFSLCNNLKFSFQAIVQNP